MGISFKTVTPWKPFKYLLWFELLSPKGPRVKRLAIRLCDKVMESLGGGASWRKLCHWGRALEGDIGTQPLPLSLCFLTSMR